MRGMTIAQSDDAYFDYLRELTGARKIGGDAGVVHDDALTMLQRLPRCSVDLIFADPPYFLSNGGTTNRAGKRVSVDKGEWDRSRGRREDHAFQSRWLIEAQRVLKPSGTIWVSGTYHAIFSIGFAMQEIGCHVLNTIAWCKTNPPPNLARRCFTHANELIIWAAPAEGPRQLHRFAYKQMHALNGGKPMPDWWTIPVAPARERRWTKHPTQKPERLLERIIAASTVPGGLVVDPFSGSFTTGAVAMKMGRRFIGSELDSRYVEGGTRRIFAAYR